MLCTKPHRYTPPRGSPTHKDRSFIYRNSEIGQLFLEPNAKLNQPSAILSIDQWGRGNVQPHLPSVSRIRIGEGRIQGDGGRTKV